MNRVIAIIKVLLGSVLMLYAYAKFSGAQFPKLEIYDAVNTIDPVLLVFYFYGYSQPYAMFCAACELIAALLILVPRTSRFGLPAYFGFTLNIAVMDWCFQFALPAKLLITFLCGLSLLVIILDRKRIIPLMVETDAERREEISVGR
jgi:hypothetical protein